MKFSFITVEEFKEIDRIPANERNEILLKNILKLHSIKVVENGLLALQETCVQCSPSTLCEKCLKAIPTAIIEDADDSDDEDGERIDDDEIDSTDEESDSDEENVTDDVNFGYAVWAKYNRTWYPASGFIK